MPSEKITYQFKWYQSPGIVVMLLLTVLSAGVLFGLVVPKVYQAFDNKLKIERKQEKISEINRAIDSLAIYDELDLSQRLQLMNQILPAKTDVSLIIANVVYQADQKQLTINTAEAKESEPRADQDVVEHSLSLEVSGKRDDLLSLVNQVVKFSPLINLEEFEIKQLDDEQLESDLVFSTFTAQPIKVSGQIDINKIKRMNPNNEELFQLLSELKPIDEQLRVQQVEGEFKDPFRFVKPTQ